MDCGARKSGYLSSRFSSPTCSITDCGNKSPSNETSILRRRGRKRRLLCTDCQCARLRRVESSLVQSTCFSRILDPSWLNLRHVRTTCARLAGSSRASKMVIQMSAGILCSMLCTSGNMSTH